MGLFMPRPLLIAIVVCGMTPPLSAAETALSPLGFYHQSVEPLLQAHCQKCHGPGKNKGGLSFAGREAVLRGGESGAAVDLAQPHESLLIKALNYDGYEMPPAGKLPPEQIAVFVKWVELGLPMPEGEAVPAPAQHGTPQVTEETKNHWSFRPLVRPAVPAVGDADWVVNPIDAFVLSRLEAAGLAPSAAAPPQQLARRLHYNLVGLPPSREWVAALERNPTSKRYGQLIEELLESPHHGEHFARYWLDLVRYGETNSYERDNPKPFVWRYRDYVIDFFNSPRGFDQFIREQLAGDELAVLREQAPDQARTDVAKQDLIIATGFYRLGVWDDEPVDAELAFYDGLDDIVGTTAQSFLGLTLNCARCHDHKLDPLSQRDYYQFASFFRNIRHYGARSDESVYAASVQSIATPEAEQLFAREKQEWQERVKSLRQQLDDVEARIRPHLKGGEKDDFEHDSQRLRVIQAHVGAEISREEVDEYARIRKTWTDLCNHPPRSADQALAIKEHGPTAPATHVLIRGNPHAAVDIVEPAFPAILSAPVPRITPQAASTGRRLALAEWIASPDNPLTARVIVNRVWQWHFGRGLVESPNDFGLKGTPPTHPELLDWLAAELIEQGWSLRHLHRLILTSNTYRQSSAPREDGLQVDPTNRLFWRFDMRRLRAEELRDSILAVNETLNLAKMFGPSVRPKIEAEVLAGQSRPGAGWEVSSPEDQRRRSIYIHIKRSLAVPLLANFDAAEPDVTCPVRFATTQPTQALSLLNSGFMQEQAKLLAESLTRRADEPLEARVRLGLATVTQREPTPADIERGLALVNRLQHDHKLSADQALACYCLALLNLNEFVYLD
jgi:hypothetical protein